jgi:hypothetical protein
MKNIFFILLCCLIFTNYKTLKESDYIPNLSQENFLPSLKAEYDIDNLYIVYAYGKSKVETGKNTMDSKLIYLDLTEQSKPYVNDIIKSYKNEVSQIIKSAPTTNGTVKLFIHNYFNKHTGGQAFFVIYTNLWLLGVPVTSVNVNLDIELVISNKSGELIKSYKAKGHGGATAAAYWSYGITDARRKANLIAFQKAMGSIKNEMKNDSVYLTNTLSPFK